MNISIIKIWGIAMLLGITFPGTQLLAAGDNSSVVIEVCVNEYNEKTESDIRDRLMGMNGLVEMKYTPEVRSYIKGYLNYKEGASAIIGRQSIFFPLFEDVLRERGLPSELKYLPIVESALKPGAISRVGAAGLWQLMKPTGQMLGLTVNRTVDERRNPYKSTYAAADYLEMLYNEFEDWTLAIAAYNSGPGRVRRAVSLGGTKDYWKIRKYLPRETRNYVPAFIAVTYLANYYYMHDIQPVLEHPDFLSVENISLYEKISFNEISQITGVSVDIIKALNPCYLRHYIPSNEQGSFVMLPRHAASTLLNHLYRPDLPSIDAFHILQDNVLIGHNERRLMRLTLEAPEKLPAVDAKVDLDQGSHVEIYFPIHRINREPKDPVWYKMGKRESLYDISRKKNIPLSKLIALNAVNEQDLGPGRVIRLQ